ncbi:hypothetical protein [Rhizobium sp. FY34]|uniref:hypothetical protein n=1 Tax=Rhizobium sp. FY34 TaxID=2562309 RepID=UPI0010C00F05|nr:hypothetical protein [Rhizobium sp. FY34]
MSGNPFYSFALLVLALVFFAVLALDIAIPALVLSLMALVRWSMLPADDRAMNRAMKGRTA